MRDTINILVIIAAAFVTAFSAARAYSAEELKFRHITSIYSDDKEMGLKQPEGVAYSQKSFLIIADTGNSRLLRYRFKDKTVASEGSVINVPQLRYPRRTQVNSRGEIFAFDGKLRRIIRITADGKFSGYVDPQRSSPPPSFAPLSFDIDKDDNIYILDIFSRKVMVLNTRGEYRKHIKFPKKFGAFTDLTVDDTGNVLLLDGANARVFSTAVHPGSFAAITEGMQAYMRFPASLTTDRQGRIYLLDRNGGKIIILARDGSFLGRLSARGWKEGLLNYPAQLCVNERGEIFVADTNNSRVQVFAEIK